jgi:preprotein translocase subunit SecG
MGFCIGLLTFVLVLNCIVLILLVLMQLPKKDAGAGLAFGGGATDALFGAGSGNVLTKATKYSATIFFVLAILIGVLQSKYHDRSKNALISATAELPGTPGTATPAAPGATAPVVVPDQPATNNFTLETTAPAASSTNPPATE